MPETINSNIPESQTKNRASSRGDDEDEISLLDLVAILWKRKRLIIGITAVAMVGVLAYAIGSMVLPPEKSYLPNVYTPKATMLIQSGSSSSMSAALAASGLSNLAGLAGVSGVGNSNGQLAQVLGTSNATLDALNEKFDFSRRYKINNAIVSGTRDKIKKNLSVKFDEKTNLLTVSYTDIDPKLAKEVVDETVRLLADRFSVLGGNKAVQQKELLEKKLAEVDEAVNNLEAQVKAFQSKYGVVQVEALATEQITILARLRSELILKEMDISNYEKVSKINDPVIIQLKNERDNLLAKIKEIETGQGSGSRVMPSQKELPTIAFEYAKLERDLAVQTELFKLLTQQYELAKLNASGQDPAFQVLEMAEIPDKKSGPSRGMICEVTTLAAFFIAVLIVFVAESIEKMKNNPETVARFKALSSGKRTKR